MIKKRCPKCERYYVPGTEVCQKDGTRLVTVLIEALDGRTLLKRYFLEEEIGRGGMGIVYRGKHLKLDQAVAVKFLVQNVSDESSSLKRFKQEARAASSLNHPGIVRVTDFDVSEDGLPFLVMDLIEGETLSERISAARKSRKRSTEPSPPVPIETALSIIIQVADALIHAHNHNVVHRDIKSSNIMLVTADDGAEKPVILDFSIAKLFAQGGSAKQHLTRSGEVFGSPLYMSPEQCMGQASDHRSDLYSLACVAYELIIGKPPFVGDNVLQTIYKHINEEPRELQELCADRAMPDELNYAIMKALSKKPDKRQETATEFKRDLETAEQKFRAGERGSRTSLSSDRKSEDTSIRFYRIGAEEGDAARQFDLGCCYFSGDGVRKDLDLAHYWFRKAALQGDPWAQNQMGHMCYYGWGREQDYEEALAWYRKAAEQENLRAQANMGWCYERGHGVGIDFELAAYWYRKAAEQDDPDAQVSLAEVYRRYLNEPAQALIWFRRAANHGDAIALARLAEFEEDPEERKEALAALEELAESGVGEAQHQLGILYQYGAGVDEDHEKAMHWLTRAAESDVAAAQLELGRAYQYGLLGQCDFLKAQHWLTKCTEYNIADGYYLQALLYEDGNGVPQDGSQAFSLLKTAANQGSSMAQFHLSFYYRLGIGTKKDVGAADQWLARAARDNKYPPAIFYLGFTMADRSRRKAAREEGTRLMDQAVELGFNLYCAASDRKSDSVPYEAGDRVKVNWKDSWWDAIVLYRSKVGPILIHYTGWESHSDEWVTADRIKGDDRSSTADSGKQISPD